MPNIPYPLYTNTLSFRLGLSLYTALSWRRGLFNFCGFFGGHLALVSPWCLSPAPGCVSPGIAPWIISDLNQTRHASKAPESPGKAKPRGNPCLPRKSVLNGWKAPINPTYYFRIFLIFLFTVSYIHDIMFTKTDVSPGAFAGRTQGRGDIIRHYPPLTHT